MFISWLAFCVAPLAASVYVNGPIELRLAAIEGGISAVGVGVSPSDAPPTSATQITFRKGVLVDVARTGARLVAGTSRLTDKTYCTAPLVGAVASTDPVQYWALGYGKCCGDGAVSSVPTCWDVGGAGAAAGVGSGGVVRALSFGTVQYSKTWGRVDLGAPMDDAKANAISRHPTLTDGLGSIYVSIVAALSGPDSVPHRLRAEQGPATFWAIATGAIFLTSMLTWYALLNYCKAAGEDGGGYGPRSCLAIWGDPLVCDPLMCVGEDDVI
jgi:hypothetical protein